MKNTCFFLAFVFSVCSYSQIDSIPLEEVIINDLSIPQPLKYTTEASVIITSDEINRGNSLELSPILNRVSGVFMQSGTLNTNRISIRGIGARNLFGTASIRAYFGDIPLTDGNGESTIEDLELGSVSRIQIHKGPSSSSYGVGLGGAIILQPKYISNTTAQGRLSSTLGSYGLRRILASAAIGREKSSLNLIYSNTHTDGYRNNNEFNRSTITLTSSFDVKEKDNFLILGSYISINAGIPSSLSLNDFNENPRQAAFTWGQAKAFEDVDYGILGLTWKHNYNQRLSLNTSIFSSFKDNYEPRPFNILAEKSNSFGIRSRALGKHMLANKELNWTLGGELFFDQYTGKTYDNLYEDFATGTGSVPGELLSDLDEKRYYYNFFTEVNYSVNKKLKFNAGIHLNQTSFEIKDQFFSDGNDTSGDFDFNPILSPKLGFNYELDQNFIIFGNIAHGFSTPTTSETLLPDGLFNPEIKPEIGWNYEIGTRYQLLNNKLYGSLSLYTLRVRDLLVSRRTEEDNFFAINAGKTIHNGIETEINYSIIKSIAHELSSYINLSLYEYTFDEFIDLDNDFSGNDLTGVPSGVINLGMDLTTKKGLYGNINVQTVGKIPANDANTVFSDSYSLLHSKVGFKNKFGDHFMYNIYLGANNILDTQYASQLQINARGFGSTAPRYFYPGLPFNIYGGININYRL